MLSKNQVTRCQWEKISRIRLLEVKGQTKNSLAIAVSRTHRPLLRQAVPFEPVAHAAAVILRQQSLVLLINAFSRSVLSDGAQKFELAVLIDWITTTTLDDMLEMMENVVQDDDPAIVECFKKRYHSVITHTYSQLKKMFSNLPTIFCSVIAGEMTRAKANALVQELSLLCIIFPFGEIASDEPVEFPRSSKMFRYTFFVMFFVVVLILPHVFSCYTAKRIF